ncbi:hypothetical protein [Rhizobium leguminosarum]|uniref:hypothetical protein n=1 Tax=Rhizobium leguminosarum TaxID=384 RepID=UPI001C960E63|nr:hypothetical protein [Rhizobium leguminosarum]MBY5585786.1 hypothetical protein [Rhizobium leguminosarum]
MDSIRETRLLDFDAMITFGGKTTGVRRTQPLAAAGDMIQKNPFHIRPAHLVDRLSNRRTSKGQRPDAAG